MKIAVLFAHRAVAELIAGGLRARKGVTKVDVFPFDKGLQKAVKASDAAIFIVDGMTVSTALLADRLQLLTRNRPSVPVLLLARSDRELLLAAVRHGVMGIVEPDAGADRVMQATQHLLEGHSWLPATMVGALVNGGSGAAQGGALEQLSPRQRQVFDLIGNGMTVQQIADLLGVGIKTVQTHRSRLMQSLGLKRSHELVVLAARAQGSASR